mgnify:CR=1 FL=1
MRNNTCLYLIVCAVAFAISSCGSSYNIKGSSDVAVLDGQKFYLKTFQNDEFKDIDSCDVVHGQFKFTGTTDSVRLAYLTNDASILPLILEGGDISIQLNMAEEKVSGTALNDKFMEFRKQLNKITGEIDDLTHKQSQGIMNGENEDSLNMALSPAFVMLNARQDSLITNFICNNFDNVLGSAAFQFVTFPIVIQQGAQLSPWIEEIMSKANDTFKNDPYVKKYMEQAKQVEGIMNGTVELPQQNAQQPAPTPDTAPVTPNQLAAPADSAR